MEMCLFSSKTACSYTKLLWCCFFAAGLAHLCEFIEDCEHVELATRILHLLGREGPRTSKPHTYIRFIYNRVLLETPEVRAGTLASGCELV